MLVSIPSIHFARGWLIFLYLYFMPKLLEFYIPRVLNLCKSRLSAMYKCQDYWFCINTEFIGTLYSKIIGSLYAKIIRYLYAHSYISIEICSFIYIYSFMPFIVTKKVLRLFCKDQLTLTFKLNYHIWNLNFSVCPPVPF